MTAGKHFKRAVRRRAAKTGESYTAALRHFRVPPEEPPVKTQTPLACTFCGKPKTDVAKLIAGPGVFICDGCVALCTEVIAEATTTDRPTPAEPGGPRQLAPERLLEWLPASVRTLRSVEADIVAKVDRLRDSGVGWDRISTALGMTADEAQAWSQAHGAGD